MGKIPYQCLFKPSDHGLICDFLNCKLRGEALMYDDAVFELERHYIYGGKTPWDIFYATIQQENEDAVYLFTTPPAPNENNASTGMLNNNNNNSNGAWKVRRNGSSVPVTDPDNGNQVIGFKKSFIYEKKSTSKKDGVQWFLTEYTTLQPPMMQSLNLVVCKIEKIEEW